ncbi:unnamed protein product [Heligmosomoides polygyrus]|uniref:Vacuolar protein sorting-associated protein VTA1 n=1 Tax=Heligmosomoides polygyrus TaxID=6339 RepID=A0A183FNY0_HELPZ|nr:unnamed protein product [Heligmosomoides polygyrus]
MAAKVPASLKPIAHYIKIANENSSRDPVVYYWCLFYAVQNAMQLDKSSPEALQFLTGLLSTLETIKKQLAGTEAITNEMIAQAHLENFALKLFNFADAKEKTGQVDKSVVHAFYTAGHVMDVLSLFGEVDEPFLSSKKYAKWKSTQIFSCLKEGKPYVPSSQQHEGSNEFDFEVSFKPIYLFGPSYACAIPYLLHVSSISEGGERKPSVEAFNEARKFTKYALSAIDYEDTRAVVENLRKALALMEKY